MIINNIYPNKITFRNTNSAHDRKLCYWRYYGLGSEWEWNLLPLRKGKGGGGVAPCCWRSTLDPPRYSWGPQNGTLILNNQTRSARSYPNWPKRLNMGGAFSKKKKGGNFSGPNFPLVSGWRTSDNSVFFCTTQTAGNLKKHSNIILKP